MSCQTEGSSLTPFKEQPDSNVFAETICRVEIMFASAFKK